MFVLVFIYLGWVYCAILLYTMGNVEPSDSPFTHFVFNAQDYAIAVFYLFGLLWINQFLHAFFYTVYAGACCSWYFRRREKSD